ncbi:MAG: pantetheine-phosphate adenylyltransferase [Chloroflexota bacterium]
MTTALYPGSFDPATNGHLDIACRAAAIFDNLIVGVYDAPPKNVLFSTEERVAMFAQAMAGCQNVTVVEYSGLTVDFAKKVGASVIVRGLRAMTDFELELQMALLNRKLSPGIETVCFMTAQEYSFLSSSVIKEIAKLGGCVDHLVPPHVKVALVQAFKDRPDVGPIPRYLNS